MAKLSPFEMRPVQSIVVCPACKPLTSKVNATPLVVALLPLLPAIAAMNDPFCGAVKSGTAFAPKRLEATGLFISTSAALNLQLNSALAYPVGGTSSRLTLTTAVPVGLMLGTLTVVDTRGICVVVVVGVTGVFVVVGEGVAGVAVADGNVGDAVEDVGEGVTDVGQTGVVALAGSL